MRTIEYIIGISFLVTCAILDLKYRSIPLILLFGGGIGAGIDQVIRFNGVFLCLGGCLVGVLFLLVSRVTGEAFGYGDSILILVLGLYLGLWQVLTLLAIAFFLAAVCSIFMVVGWRQGLKNSIPFVPFLVVGYLGVICF